VGYRPTRNREGGADPPKGDVLTFPTVRCPSRHSPKRGFASLSEMHPSGQQDPRTTSAQPSE